MPRKPKHTLTELIAALERVRSDAVAAWCVEWHIKQRRASKDNPGRPPIKTGKYDAAFEPKEGKHEQKRTN